MSAASRAAMRLGRRRARVLAALSSGRASPWRVPAVLSRLADDYFCRRAEELALPAGAALAAVGGYGRGLLCPGSDIDALLLFPEALPPGVETLAEGLFHPLWDLGLKLGHGVRTVQDCARLATDDVQVLASLLSLRPLAGDAAVVAELGRSVLAVVDARALAAGLDASAPAGPPDLSAADLKNGGGGLRDVQRVRWLLVVAAADSSLPDLDPATRESLEHGEALLWATRAALHGLTGGKLDVLPLDLVAEVAERLNFAGQGGLSAGEVLLSALARAMDLAWTVRRALLGGELGRRLELPAGFDGTATAVLDAARLAMVREARFSWPASRTLTAASQAWSEALQRAPQGLDLVEAALADAPLALENLLETGVLEALVPEFAEIRHLKLGDFLHRHAVDRHSLLAVAELNVLLAGEGPAPALVDATALRWATLLHDVGKGRGDHTESGARIVETALGRLGVEPRRVAEVAFLVRRHMELWDIAARGNLGDETTVAKAASLAGTPERLAGLYLLSQADAMATGPYAWNPWRASLLADLYAKAANMLARGPLAVPDAAERLRAAAEGLRQLAADSGLADDLVEDCLASMNPRYVLTVPPEVMTEHLGQVRDFREELAADRARMPHGQAGLGLVGLHCRHLPMARAVELTFVALDQPRLFATISGVLALHNLDVLAAEVHTWKDGTVVDIFRVAEPADMLYAEELWTRVRLSVRWAFTGRLSMDERLAEKRASPLAKAAWTVKSRAEVRVDNQTSDFHTLLDIRGQDRPGRLYELAKVLADSGVSILWARIATAGRQVRDTFAVRSGGGRLLDAERLRALRAALRVAAKG